MLYTSDSFPGREIMLKGEKFLYFGGTAYLGLQTDPDFQNIFIKNVKRFGTNYGASRNANVRLSVFEEAESHLAKLIGSEDCLTMSSGYLAGQMVSKYFHRKGHPCFFAPGTHQAMHSLESKNYKDHESLIIALKKVIEAESKSPALFLESISLDGKNYPGFEWLKRLPTGHVILVVDDSHGMGIVGKEGGGVFESIVKIKPKELIICGSLSKGFGVQAGAICGNSQLIYYLKATEMFAAASPAAPASLATLIQSASILAAKRKLLQDNIAYFLAKLNDTTPFRFMHRYPSFAFDDSELSAHLVENNIIVTDFNYPTENDSNVQRIVLSAHHTKNDLNLLVSCLRSYFE